MAAASAALTEVFFLLQKSGLTKTLKAFRKETGFDEVKATAPVEAVGHVKERSNKKKKRQRELEKDDDVTLQQEIESKVAELQIQQLDLAQPKKKRRKSEKSSNAVTPNSQCSTTDENGGAALTPKKKDFKDHFKRIDDAKWLPKIKDDRLRDQSFWTKGGDEFARKAAEDLGRVKGKDFRKEMQKKKRASWKGMGQIDDKVNSIQFDSD